MHKFDNNTMKTINLVIWDQKEIQNFPREDFIKPNKLALSINFKMLNG